MMYVGGVPVRATDQSRRMSGLGVSQVMVKDGRDALEEAPLRVSETLTCPPG